LYGDLASSNIWAVTSKGAKNQENRYTIYLKWNYYIIA